MTYHPLANDSGSTAEERIAEARRILGILRDHLADEPTPKEAEFIEQMQDRDYCTVKQLFWLRDIKDKYL